MPERYEHTGNAVATTLTNSVGTGDTTLIVASATGWPTGAVGKFWIVLDRGLATEEKVLATSRSGTTISGAARGADGTSAFAHGIGATVEHMFSATEADDASAHLMASTDRHGLTGGAAVVGTSQTQTLTNKTINGANNTLTVPQSQVTNLVGDQATQDSRLTAVEGINTTQNSRLDTLETKVHVVCTSSTRPGSPVTGLRIFETDTKAFGIWDGAAWQMYDTIWQTFTPTLTAVTTNPTLGAGSAVNGSYKRGGKAYDYKFRIKFGTSGVNAGSGTYQIDLPINTELTSDVFLGTVWIEDASGGPQNYMAVATAFSASQFNLRIHGTAGAVTHNSQVPWAASDAIRGLLRVEAA